MSEGPTLTDQHRAFYLSLALVSLEVVREHEPPKSARWNRLNSAMDAAVRATDCYNWGGWNAEDCGKAAKLIDEINERIKEMFPVGEKS